MGYISHNESVISCKILNEHTVYLALSYFIPLRCIHGVACYHPLTTHPETEIAWIYLAVLQFGIHTPKK